MNASRRICVVSGGRADYGLLQWVMHEINAAPDLELQLIVTGSHLEPRFGLTVEQPPPVDVFYEGEGPIVFGDYHVRVVHTPGHCPGGVCLAISKAGDPSPPHLFVGDTLFAGSIGRTDLPGGNYDTLLTSITQTLFAFPDDSIVYSGHGPETTIGCEKTTNPFVLEYLAGRRV